MEEDEDVCSLCKLLYGVSLYSYTHLWTIL